MAHWAELDENNIVLRVLVGSNEDADESYQWLIDNLGGRWLKTSYNTVRGVHTQGGTPLRWNFASVGHSYREDLDAFIAPCIFVGWVFDDSTMDWIPPHPKPDSGFWYWNNDIADWDEITDR